MEIVDDNCDGKLYFQVEPWAKGESKGTEMVALNKKEEEEK